jgi:hypothetical protein
VEKLDLRLVRELAGPVVTLLRASGVRGEEEVRAFGVEPEPLARGAPLDAAEAVEVQAGGQHGDAVALRHEVREPGLGERRRDRGREGDPLRQRAAQAADRGVGEVGAVEGDHVGRAPDGQRAPAWQAHVRVHDVEPLVRVAAAQLAGGAQVGAAALAEREQLDLHALDGPERLDLVAHEPARCRARGRGPQVRDDEDPHAALSVVRAAAAGGAAARPPRPARRTNLSHARR